MAPFSDVPEHIWAIIIVPHLMGAWFEGADPNARPSRLLQAIHPISVQTLQLGVCVRWYHILQSTGIFKPRLSTYVQTLQFSMEQGFDDEGCSDGEDSSNVDNEGRSDGEGGSDSGDSSDGGDDHDGDRQQLWVQENLKEYQLPGPWHSPSWPQALAPFAQVKILIIYSNLGHYKERPTVKPAVLLCLSTARNNCLWHLCAALRDSRRTYLTFGQQHAAKTRPVKPPKVKPRPYYGRLDGDAVVCRPIFFE
ncbi:hypothetical protein FPV67DRAFT_1672571 [Lyophyllum atratum]|nr:hypothetical protein FPV67DRAFT_1672571 [Lyophyllum atratum]